MTQRKPPENNTGNLFHIPQLPKRIMEKAVQELKLQHYPEAKKLFAQLLEIDEEHGQAAYGLAICLLELADYEPAEKLTREMLEKDMGDYFEVFRLHITVLIQTNQYDKGAQMLEGILEEIDMPEETRNSFEQLFDFCKVRQHDGNDGYEPIDEVSPLPASEPSPAEVKRLLSALVNEPDTLSADGKWSAIHALYDLKAEQTFEIVQPLLLNETFDPFLKTLMLKILGENGFSGNVEIKKFNTLYKVKIHNDQKLINPLTKDIKTIIHDTLMSENPTICQQVLDAWEHFSYASYPMNLMIGSSHLWAAACTQYVYKLNGLEDDLDAIIELYSVTPRDCSAQLREIEKVEGDPSSLDFV